jgi:hypothetical protein
MNYLHKFLLIVIVYSSFCRFHRGLTSPGKGGVSIKNIQFGKLHKIMAAKPVVNFERV